MGFVDQQSRQYGVVAIAILTLLLGSCARLQGERNTVTNPDAAAPQNANQPTATTEAPAPTGTNTAPGSETPLTCRTTNSVAEVNWVQGSPQLTVSSNANTLTVNNAPANAAVTSDGGTAYTLTGDNLTGDNTITATLYPNGYCVLQAVRPDGTVTVNEEGQVATEIAQVNQPYQEGFNAGYQQGFQDGQSFRLSNFGNDPERALGQGPQTGDNNYDGGFRDGFYVGFEAGYTSVDTPTPQPPQNEFSPAPSEPITGFW